MPSKFSLSQILNLRAPNVKLLEANLLRCSNKRAHKTRKAEAVQNAVYFDVVYSALISTRILGCAVFLNAF